MLAEATMEPGNSVPTRAIVPMTFVPAAQTDTYAKRLSSEESAASHAFTPTSPGLIEVRTWWQSDYPRSLEESVWCGDVQLRSARGFSAAGLLVSSMVSVPGPCEVRMRQTSSSGNISYRVAIRYPR